jgi:hypothetical protein
LKKEFTESHDHKSPVKNPKNKGDEFEGIVVLDPNFEDKLNTDEELELDSLKNVI